VKSTRGGRGVAHLRARLAQLFEHLAQAVERHGALAGAGAALEQGRAAGADAPRHELLLLRVEPQQEPEQLPALPEPEEVVGRRHDEVGLAQHLVDGASADRVEHPGEHVLGHRAVEQRVLGGDLQQRGVVDLRDLQAIEQRLVDGPREPLLRRGRGLEPPLPGVARSGGVGRLGGVVRLPAGAAEELRLKVLVVGVLAAPAQRQHADVRRLEGVEDAQVA
jgi:hypothetical protein